MPGFRFCATGPNASPGSWGYSLPRSPAHAGTAGGVRGRTRGRRSLFTLAETVLAVALGTVLIAGILTTLLLPLDAWHEGVALFMLNEQSRVFRERILRGFGQYQGLRNGRRDSVQITSDSGHDASPVDWINFEVDNNEIPTPENLNDDINCWFRSLKHRAFLHLAPVPKEDNKRDVLAGEVNLIEMHIDQDGPMVTLDYTLEVTVGRRTLRQRERFSTYLPNP